MSGLTVVISVMSDVFSLCPPDLDVTVWGKSAYKRLHCATSPLWKKKDFTHRLIQFSKTRLKVQDLLEKWQSSSSWNLWCSGHVWDSSLSNIHALPHPLGPVHRTKTTVIPKVTTLTGAEIEESPAFHLQPLLLACFNFILLKNFPF